MPAAGHVAASPAMACAVMAIRAHCCFSQREKNAALPFVLPLHASVFRAEEIVGGGWPGMRSGVIRLLPSEPPVQFQAGNLVKARDEQSGVRPERISPPDFGEERRGQEASSCTCRLHASPVSRQVPWSCLN